MHAWDGVLRTHPFLLLKAKHTEQTADDSVLEIQAFLVEIIGKFEVTMTERSEKVIHGPSGLMSPVIEGELERGTQLPLAVSVAAREDDG